jgi:hypothetical protein
MSSKSFDKVDEKNGVTRVVDGDVVVVETGGSDIKVTYSG